MTSPASSRLDSQTPFRLAGLLLAAAVAAAAIRLIATNPPEAIQSINPEPPTSLSALAKAVRENAISPYRWLELAEGYEDAGNFEKARQSLIRAEVLAPNLPPVWIRSAAFYFRRGERARALAAGARAQAISPDADAFLFQNYDRFVRDTPMVIAALSTDPRSLIAWFHHLMEASKPDDAALVWTELIRRHLADRQQAIAYVQFLLGQHRYQLAQSVWLQQVPQVDRGPYPADAIFNGGFELPPSGCPLDWKITLLEGVAMDRDQTSVHEGKYSLRIRFAGNANLDFQNVSQAVVVTPGEYRFSAWLRTAGVTTDQGIRFSLTDAESPERVRIETDSVRGDGDWRQVTYPVFIPAETNLLTVTVRRLASGKFDNKIAGTVWIDSVSLIRAR